MRRDSFQPRVVSFGGIENVEKIIWEKLSYIFILRKTLTNFHETKDFPIWPGEELIRDLKDFGQIQIKPIVKVCSIVTLASPTNSFEVITINSV